jgi:RED-like protein N-terminal region
MNNDQFRRLVLDQPGNKRADNATSTSPKRDQPASGVLGSRFRASIPMTPRNVKGGSGTADFARQLAEQRREEHGQRPTKRFKSSAAPKGTKLASGYQDRTALRRGQEDETKTDEKEDVALRLKALEDMMKLGQIDSTTFENLRKEIGVGGDLGSTHMIKGLDWDLLKRVRAGEDLEKTDETQEEEKEEVEEKDVDEELDRVLEHTEGMAPPPPREKKVKKGTLAGKMSRDEILRQLKASRAAAAEEALESTLSSKFKKIKDDKPEKKRWVETDPSGRRKEILVITDAEGKTKRKVRWLDKEKPKEMEVVSKVDDNGLLRLDQDAKPLGMEVPAVVAAKLAAEAAAAQAEAEDDDIFAGIGTDYNPLGDLDEDDSDEDEGEEKEEKVLESKPEALPTEPSAVQQPPARRNYFNDKTTEEETARTNPLTSDPTLLAALKRAAALRQASSTGAEEGEEEEGELGGDVDEDPEKLAHRKKFLEERRRRDAQDALDLDYGFGSSRIEDEEDEEGPTFDEGQRSKRKRGPKKKKGDKDSAADVLRVMEGRKK